MESPEKHIEVVASPMRPEHVAFERKRPLRDGLGQTGALIIFLGVPFELGALCFLFFLWAGEGAVPGGENAPPFWRLITLRGWATQTVTISTVVLRTVVDLQAVVCTALGASLMIEALDVPFFDIGLFSILRVENGGPWSLLRHLLHSASPWKIFHSWPPALIFVLWLCSLGVQFSSTILVSDFRTTQLLPDPQIRPVPITEGLPMFLSTMVGGTWKKILPEYPTFAESGPFDQYTGPHVSDTGMMRRVFIPLQTKERASLRRYEGPAITHRSQVMCVAPSFTGRVVTTGSPELMGSYLREPAGSISDQDFIAHLRGSISWDRDIVPQLPCPFGIPCSVPFPMDCRIPVVMDEPPATTDYIDQLNRRLGSSQSTICMILAWGKSSPAIYLALNATGRVADWLSSNDTDLGTSPRKGEWAEFEFGPRATLKATLCAVYINYTLDHVQMESASDPIQPVIEKDLVSGNWDVRPILNLLGVGSPLHKERGILNLTNSTTAPLSELGRLIKNDPLTPKSGNGSVEMFEGPYSFLGMYATYMSSLTGGITPVPQNFTIQFCWTCLPYGANNTPIGLDPHAYHVIMFHEILANTGHASLAIHALFTILSQVLYYGAQAAFDYGGNATLVFSQSVSVPRVWWGLGSVVGITLLHIFCVATITILFVKRTRYSFYGNAWHAIAQVVSPEVTPILENATQMTDQQVRTEMRRERLSRVNSGLDQHAGSRRVVMRRIRGVPEDG